jgi:hypothetical protein
MLNEVHGHLPAPIIPRGKGVENSVLRSAVTWHWYSQYIRRRIGDTQCVSISSVSQPFSDSRICEAAASNQRAGLGFEVLTAVVMSSSMFWYMGRVVR